jgi:hypothetical protein
MPPRRFAQQPDRVQIAAFQRFFEETLGTEVGDFREFCDSGENIEKLINKLLPGPEVRRPKLFGAFAARTRRDYVITLAKARGVPDPRSQLSGDCMDKNQPNIRPLLVFLEAITQKAGVSMEQYVDAQGGGEGPRRVMNWGLLEQKTKLENEWQGYLRKFDSFMADHRRMLEDIRKLSNQIFDNPSVQNLEMAVEILKNESQKGGRGHDDAVQLYHQIVTIDTELNGLYGQLNQKREVVAIPNPQNVFDELISTRTELRDRLEAAITPLQKRNREINEAIDQLQLPSDIQSEKLTERSTILTLRLQTAQTLLNEVQGDLRRQQQISKFSQDKRLDLGETERRLRNFSQDKNILLGQIRQNLALVNIYESHASTIEAQITKINELLNEQ